MSQTATREIECSCGVKVAVFCADSINAERHPHMRQAVLDRQLHVFRCAACDTSILVENQLWYIDFARGQFYGVFPTASRADERACSQAVFDAFELALGGKAGAAARALLQSDKMHVRTCFGNEELREKMIIQEAGLRDLAVEVLKAKVLVESVRFGLELPRLEVQTLRLDHVEDTGDLAFYFEQGTTPPRVLEIGVVIPRRHYEEIAAVPWQELLAKYPFASGPHVSMLRVLVPGVPAPP
jgi:CpXC protein